VPVLLGNTLNCEVLLTSSVNMRFLHCESLSRSDASAIVNQQAPCRNMIRAFAPTLDHDVTGRQRHPVAPASCAASSPASSSRSMRWARKYGFPRISFQSSRVGKRNDCASLWLHSDQSRRSAVFRLTQPPHRTNVESEPPLRPVAGALFYWGAFGGSLCAGSGHRSSLGLRI
jgi:hypothetical protein